MSPEQSHSASRVLSRSVSATGIFLRKQLWIWPVIAAVVLGMVGWSIRAIVEDAVKRSMSDNLQTILDADVLALRIWLKNQESSAEAIAADELVRNHVATLVALAAAEDSTAASLTGSESMNALRKELKPWLAGHGYDGFAVVDSQRKIVAAQRDELVGREDLPIQDGLLEQPLAVKTTVSRPFQIAFSFRPRVVRFAPRCRQCLSSLRCAAPTTKSSPSSDFVFGRKSTSHGFYPLPARAKAERPTPSTNRAC
jgi:hypothetical protein